MITPHKGGRTERVPCRVTLEIKNLLAQITEQSGKSAADLLEEAVLAKAKELGIAESE